MGLRAGMTVCGAVALGPLVFAASSAWPTPATYPGANGVKTGYTHKSGPCLVASATRGSITLVAVVLNSPNMYADTTRLLDFGFASLG